MSAFELPSSSGQPGVWQDFTPVLTASTTNPTLGAASVQDGRYVQIGKIVHFFAKVEFGSSGVAAGSGTYLVSLPVLARTDEGNTLRGQVFLLDNSAVVGRIGIAYSAGGTDVQMWVDSAVTVVTNASPWTWAASDRIWILGTYEAAA